MKQEQIKDSIEYGFDFGKITAIIAILILVVIFLNFGSLKNAIDDSTQNTQTMRATFSNDISNIKNSVSGINDACIQALNNYTDMANKYTTCQNEKTISSSDMISTKTLLQSCQADRQTYIDLQSHCQKQLTNLTSVFNSSQNIWGSNLSSYQNQIDQANQNYNNLASNTAKLLCCILVNQTTANFTVQDSRVACQDNGTRSVAC